MQNDPDTQSFMITIPKELFVDLNAYLSEFKRINCKTMSYRIIQWCHRASFILRWTNIRRGSGKASKVEAHNILQPLEILSSRRLAIFKEVLKWWQLIYRIWFNHTPMYQKHPCRKPWTAITTGNWAGAVDYVVSQNNKLEIAISCQMGDRQIHQQLL